MSSTISQHTSEIEDLNRKNTGTLEVQSSFHKFDERLRFDSGTVKLSTRSKNDTFVWGVSEYGGSDLYGDQSTSALFAVLNDDFVFIENFNTTTFKDSTNTTADWNTTDLEVDMTDPSNLSEDVFSDVVAYKSGTTITSATLIATASTPANTSITYYLSANNGSNYEEVTSGTKHTFTNTGEKLLWKATLANTDGVTSPEITKIRVSYA